MSNDVIFSFHHIGLACKKLETEIRSHEMLGYKKESTIFVDKTQKVKGIFMVINHFRVELLEPLDKESPINNYLKKGIRMYHQCFTTRDIEKAIHFLQEQGAILVVKPVEAIAFDQRKIAFLYLRTQMLIELIEE
ncbi:VOC family protein [Psychrobacillus sp. NPDC096623]|uniref:VOC family protein n=1 Tax=Psychrobacillus sp. NPDC096623 TaxID=3364492 RepID=UPI00380161AA